MMRNEDKCFIQGETEQTQLILSQPVSFDLTMRRFATKCSLRAIFRLFFAPNFFTSNAYKSKFKTKRIIVFFHYRVLSVFTAVLVTRKHRGKCGFLLKQTTATTTKPRQMHKQFRAQRYP